MWLLKASTAVLLLAKVALGQQQIAGCPSGDQTIKTASGSSFAWCQSTDYQGPSAQILHPVSSVTDCALACDRRSGCTQAVYYAKGQDCHLKATSGLIWVANPQFTTIRKTAKLSDGNPISTCPSKVTTTSLGDNVSFTLCDNSDFAVDSLQATWGIADVKTCATMCAAWDGCVHAVFDHIYQVCHIKGDLTNTSPNFRYNRQFSTVRLVRNTPAYSMGKWSTVINFPIIPVAAYVVPSTPAATKLLVFSSWGARQFGGPSGMTQFAEYDFTTGAVSQRLVSNTHHDMFCPGISAMGDGRIIITGGSNAEAVSIYDHNTNEFVRAPNMTIPRGYQSSATLSDGRVFTIGGSFSGGVGGKTGEVYDPVRNQWTLLNGADPAPMLTTDQEGAWREDNHGWLFSWRDGSVFQAGPSKAMNWYMTKNGGSHVSAGNRGSSGDQMCGIFVMYDTGKILSAGGSQDYTNSPATKEAHTISIGNPGQPATAARTADMKFARGFANAVVLPDGKVVVTGGQKESLVFTDTDSVLIPEVWDPTTGAWTQMAPAAIPRNYHSVSLLLPDGTVFVGGSGMCYGSPDCEDPAKDHLNGEIFSPPYLFNKDGSLATRPIISRISSSKVKVGATIKVSLIGDPAGVTFVLMRMGSATHSVNTDQRRIPITNSRRTSSGTYSVIIPDDSGAVLPGAWYLFAMSKGVPSLAMTVMVAP